VVCNNIMQTPNFTKIHPAVLEFKHADIQSRPDIRAFISYTSRKESVKSVSGVNANVV
jgi:hypothetical protein